MIKFFLCWRGFLVDAWFFAEEEGAGLLELDVYGGEGGNMVTICVVVMCVDHVVRRGIGGGFRSGCGGVGDEVMLRRIFSQGSSFNHFVLLSSVSFVETESRSWIAFSITYVLQISITYHISCSAEPKETSTKHQPNIVRTNRLSVRAMSRVHRCAHLNKTVGIFVLYARFVGYVWIS